MPDYQKDTPRQAALRREIETHAIWQYPPEERLQHNREWQSLYLLVFEFKNFLQKIEHRLQNTDASALAPGRGSHAGRPLHPPQPAARQA